MYVAGNGASICFGEVAVRNVAHFILSQKVVVFGGAGISRDSGLPIANELTGEILRLLRMPKRSKEVLSLSQPPFELFIEAISKYSDVELIYDIYKGGFPCILHQLCAQMYKNNNLMAVITTNFDSLFELSFDYYRIPYERIWRELDLEGWQPTSRQLPLLKLHGSAHDAVSLGATISRVANQRGISARENALRTACLSTGAEFILVVGYSGSDRFDINPALKRLAPIAPPVALVAHNGEMGDTAMVEQLSNHVSAGPFAPFQGVRIECDTGALLMEMAAVSNLRVISPPPSYDYNWRCQIAKWLSQAQSEHGEAIRDYLCGALLRAAAQPRHARRWFKKALNRTSSPWLRTETFLSLARCERDVGISPNIAHRAAITALRLARKKRFPQLEAAALIELGVQAADNRRYIQALRYYKRAENIARANGEIEKVGICIGNSAIVRKNMGGRRRWLRALRDFEASLNIARQAGDKRSEGRTIGNMGILYSVMGNSLLAIRKFKEAAEIARELGDLYHEAIWLVGEADDTFATDPNRAVELVLQARSIFLISVKQELRTVMTT